MKASKLLQVRQSKALQPFPWRPRLETHSNEWSLTSMVSSVRSQVSNLITMQLFATNKNAFESPYKVYGVEYMDPRDEEFFAGAKQAFTSTTNAIFNHTHLYDMNSTYQRRQAEARADKRSLAMKKWGTNTTEGGKSKQMSLEEISMLKALHGYHANLINPFNNHTDYTYSDNNIHDPLAVEQERLRALHRADLREGLEKDSMTYSPSLENIFDSKLASHFSSAIEEHFNHNQRVYYKLHHIGIPEITNCEVIFNAKRGFKFDYIKQHYVLGLIKCAVLENPDTSNSSSSSNKSVAGDAEKTSHDNKKYVNAIQMDNETRTRVRGHPFLTEAYSATSNSSSSFLSKIIGSLIGTSPRKSSHGTPRMASSVNNSSRHGNSTTSKSNNAATMTTEELLAWLAQPRIKAAADELRKMESFITLRVSVDFPCRETFYVESMDELEISTDPGSDDSVYKSKQRDMEDGHSYHSNDDDLRADLGLDDEIYYKLLQGNRERTNNIHSILLESTFDLKTLSMSDFDVVDIDGWCNDNQFWISESTNMTGGQSEEEGVKEVKEAEGQAIGLYRVKE